MNKVSSKHLMFLILGATLVSIRCYSSVFISLGKRDTWIFTLFASMIILLFLLFIFNIITKNNTYDVTEVIYGQFPKIIGLLFIFIFIIGLFLLSIESVAVFSNSIHTNYMQFTPNWFCIIIFLLASTYVLFKKFNAILSLVIIIVSITVIGDIFYLILVAPYLNLNELLPIMQDGFTKEKWLCLLSILGNLSSVSIVFPYMKFVQKKNAIISDSIFAMIILGFFTTTSIVSIISFLGPDRASNIYYPEYIQSQRILIAGFLEFGELFYIFRSVCMCFIKYILCSFGIFLLFEDKIKNRNRLIAYYTLLIFIFSFLLTKNQEILFRFLKYNQYLVLFPLLLIPLLCFTIYYFRHKKKGAVH